MRKSNFALRLQPSLFEELRGVVAAEEVTLNQFINVAVAEKLAALRTDAYFRERAARANIPAALRALERLRGDDPGPDDEVPTRRVRRRRVSRERLKVAKR